jgi:hypothetical protein
MSIIGGDTFEDTLQKAKGASTPSFNDLQGLLKSAQSSQEVANKKTSDEEGKFLSDFKAEKAEVDKIKPQDSAKLLDQIKEWKPEPQARNPIEAFGSIAAIFAMTAASFTKQPMVNALNAGAALINAQKAGDTAASEKAFDAWKENTKLALEKHDAMMSDYKTAQDKLKADFNLGKAELEIQVKKWQDPAAEHLIALGQWEDFFKLQQSRDTSRASITKTYQELQNKKLENDLIKARLSGRQLEEPTLAKDEAHVVANDAKKLMEKDPQLSPSDAMRQAILTFDKDKKAAEKTSDPQGSTARETIMNQRVLVEAKDAVSALKNMVELPLKASGGVFSSNFNGGLFSAPKSYLSGELTPNEVDAYNTIGVGLGRALSGIEVGGLQVNQHLSDQFEKLQIRPTDTHLTAALKLAQMKQDATNGLEVLRTNPHLAPAQKELAQGLLAQLNETIPWSVSDAIKMQFGGKPHDTFKSFAEKAGLEKATPPDDAVKMLKSAPETAAQFDEIFGPGAAEKVLSK